MDKCFLRTTGYQRLEIHKCRKKSHTLVFHIQQSPRYYEHLIVRHFWGDGFLIFPLYIKLSVGPPQ